MSQVKEYSIVRAASTNELGKLVNEEIKKGWYPVGGTSIVPVAVSTASAQHGFFQPMVR